MNILICNVGSTSLKFKLFDMPEEKVLIESKVEGISDNTPASFSYKDCNGYKASISDSYIRSYSEGIKLFLHHVLEESEGIINDILEIECVCFKTVLSDGYYGTHELTPEVITAMENFIPISPAHNPPYLAAIEQFKQIIPTARLVASFETDFHKTIPQDRTTYGIPYQWTHEYGLKKLGFHGASHSFIAAHLRDEYGETDKIVSAHLGGSSSLCAIDNSESVDVSFGFSNQSGCIHAQRVGDVDPAIIEYMMDYKGYSFKDVMRTLSSAGGIYGISDGIADFRELTEAMEAGNEKAKLAFDVFIHDVIKYTGIFYMEMKGLNSFVFTGGIGERSAIARAAICKELAFLGVEIDEKLNAENALIISTPESAVKVYVIPANEEIMVARKSYKCLTEQ